MVWKFYKPTFCVFVPKSYFSEHYDQMRIFEATFHVFCLILYAGHLKRDMTSKQVPMQRRVKKIRNNKQI